METILVTGGAGFIGSNLVQYLLAQAKGFRVVAFDKLTYSGSLSNLEGLPGNARFQFVRGDIADRRMVRRLLQVTRPAYILNLAAESHVDRSIDGPENFVRTNLNGTFELLEAFRRLLDAQPGLRKRSRFLHVSTDEVYGTLGPRGSFSEKTPYAPNSPYAATKAGADHLVRAYRETYGLPLLITNCSNNYGPRQFPEKLIPLTLLNALEGKSLPIYGDGGNIRDWLYVEDHCEALWTVARRGKPGEKYNIGGGAERTNLQVVALICALLDKMSPPAKNRALAGRKIPSYGALKAFVQDRPGHDRRYAIDCRKIRTKLGWRPRHDWREGMRETVRWYLDHPDWCRKVQEGKYSRERLGLARPGAAEDGGRRNRRRRTVR